jgi:hypothetical protein
VHLRRALNASPQLAFGAFRARVSFSILDLLLLLIVLNGTVLSLAYRDDAAYAVRELAVACLIVTLLSLAVLVLHGLSRMFAYRWCGVPVHAVRLDLSGDAPDASRDRSNPAIELCVGFTGIATCLMLAAAFLYLHFAIVVPYVLRTGEALYEVVTLTVIIVSLVFSVFQMCPGISQDGGQIVRGAVWYFSGTPFGSTWLTGSFSQTFAALLTLGLGLSLFFSFNVFLGIGVVLAACRVGMLARYAARHLGWQYVSVDREIELGQVLTGPGRLIAADDLVEERLPLLMHAPDAWYLVIDPEGEATGVVRAANLMALPAVTRRTALIGEVMTPIERVRSFPAERSASSVWETLRQIGIPVAVVTSNGLPVDIVSLEDLRRRLVVMSHGSAAVPALRQTA